MKRNTAYLQCSLEGVEEEKEEKRAEAQEKKRQLVRSVYVQPDKRAGWEPDCIKIALDKLREVKWGIGAQGQAGAGTRTISDWVKQETRIKNETEGTKGKKKKKEKGCQMKDGAEEASHMQRLKRRSLTGRQMNRSPANNSRVRTQAVWS